MPDIHIIISDPALREAVTEAAKIVGLNEVQEDADLTAALKDNGAALIVLDEGNLDKKTLKLLQDSGTAEKLRHIFFLGTADENIPNHLPLESFPKPLRLGHLLTRIQFYLYTKSRAQSGSISIGPWRLELHNRQIVHQENATIIRLTEKETALLDYLAQSEKPVGREELLAAIWGHDGRIDTHTLETHIYQLRRKLDPNGDGLSLLVNEQSAYRLKLS